MSRMNKIEDLLHKEIANIIVTRIDNPQIKNTVTITDIKVSKDIRSAIVYFVTLDNNFKKVEKILKTHDVYYEIIGFTQKKYFEIEGEMKIDINDLFKINNQWYNNY